MANPSMNYKLVTTQTWPVIVRVEATEFAEQEKEAQYGERGFLPQIIISDFCEDVIKHTNWGFTRPYYNPAKMIVNHYSAKDIKFPPIFFLFKDRRDYTRVREEFSHLFEFTEVRSNKMEGEEIISEMSAN